MMRIDPNVTDPRWSSTWFHTPPCCTGNQVRMLPNFIHHMWFGTPDGGLAMAMHGPSQLNTTLDGVEVSAAVSTDYPFDSTIRVDIHAATNGARSSANAAKETFPLRLRIPGWAKSDCTGTEPPSSCISLTINGGVVNSTPESGFVTVRIPFGAATVVVLELPMAIKTSTRKTFSNGDQHMPNYNIKRPWANFHGQNGTGNLPFCEVSYGPLTFALPLEGRPGQPFNFAIECNASAMSLSRSDTPVSKPFDWPLDAPLKITAAASRFAWDDAWTLPEAPVSPTRRQSGARVHRLENITLIPYGCAKQFHISMFPYLN